VERLQQIAAVIGFIKLGSNAAFLVSKAL